MLSKMDDYPIHQIAEPLAQTASSDRFCYDRFWYNGHARDGSFYFGVGMARYPNLGILDCGFSLVIDGRQYAFHGSRRAPQEPSETSVGPFCLQIIEPMGRHRLVIEENDTGISCDLVFTPYTGAIQEGRQTLRNERHVVMDATRLDQFGHWSGTIQYHGRELEVGPETFGLKDRSWGLRPVGDSYTGGAPMDNFQPVHFTWLPIHWENRCTLAGFFEDSGGYQWHNDQVITPTYSNAADIPGVNDPGIDIWKGKVGHKLQLHAGTRCASGGVIEMQDKDGRRMEISIQPKLLYRMKGIGYQHPEWGHGKWHGELAIAGEAWNCEEADPLALENMHIQQVVEARCGDEIGHGVLEQIWIGPYQSYGLEDWFDGAD